MTDSFIDIKQLLKEEKQETNLPVATIFDGLYLPKHRLQLNFVTLSNPVLKTIEPNYFRQLSEQALQLNIRLLHLWSDVYVQQKNLVEARILSLLGTRNRIHARQTSVVRIDKKQADKFLQANHLQKHTGAYYKYGLEYKGEMVAVATFSKSRVMTDGIVPYRSYELERFASKLGTTVTGGLGKLLSHFILQHHPAHLMTYADRDWSAGAGYEKLGFTLVESTSPQAFYIHPDEMIRYPIHRLPENFTEDDMKQKGYVKIFNAGSLKYILDRRA
jgi:hypothetical protein